MNFLAQPFGVVMKYLFDFLSFGNYGIAIILFTVFVRILLFPLNISQQKSALLTKKIQPEIEALKRSCGDDKDMFAKEQQKLYEKYNINPMAGCLPMLIQLPILIVIYNIIRQPLTYIAGLSSDVISKLWELAGKTSTTVDELTLNSFFLNSENYAANSTALSELGVSSNSFINMTFLKIFDLGKTPWQVFSDKDWTLLPLLLIPILTLVTQYLVQFAMDPSKLKKKKDKKEMQDPTQRSTDMMMKIMPLMTFFIAFTTPAGLGFYWTIGNLISLVQQLIVNKMVNKKEE